MTCYDEKIVLKATRMQIFSEISMSFSWECLPEAGQDLHGSIEIPNIPGGQSHP